ncbi:hypothetical protein [Fusibacter sp. JL216-2]|uniref:hypothetical protein n=1 Tax=Fusibacter sp. JL216-2 TaxID=3071453 RepID=UPI003D32CEBE
MGRDVHPILLPSLTFSDNTIKKLASQNSEQWDTHNANIKQILFPVEVVAVAIAEKSKINMEVIANVAFGAFPGLKDINEFRTDYKEESQTLIEKASGANPDEALNLVMNSRLQNVVTYKSDEFAENLSDYSQLRVDTSSMSTEDAIEFTELLRQELSNLVNMNENSQMYLEIYRGVK